MKPETDRVTDIGSSAVAVAEKLAQAIHRGLPRSSRLRTVIQAKRYARSCRVGYAYGLLQRTANDRAYGKVRAVVRSFSLENMPLAPGSDILGEAVASRAVHTIHSAAKASGIHARSMRTLFARQGLAEVEGIDGLRDHRVNARAENVAAIVETLHDALSFPQVMAVTGIPKLHLRAMVAEDHLATLTGSAGLAYAKHRFSRAAVDDLMGRLFRDAVEVPGETGRRVTVARARGMSHASTEALLRMILDGGLAWKGRIGTGGTYDTRRIRAR